MQTYVPPLFPTTPTASQAFWNVADTVGQTGSPKATCATIPSPKKVEVRAKGTVDELIRHHEVGRLVLLLERAYRRDRENPFHSKRLHGVDVGSEVQLRGQQTMSSSVTRQKRLPCGPPALPAQKHPTDRQTVWTPILR